MLAEKIREGAKLHPKAIGSFAQRIPLGVKWDEELEEERIFYNGIGATCAIGAAMVAVLVERGRDPDQEAYLHSEFTEDVFGEDSPADLSLDLYHEMDAILPRESWDDWREPVPGWPESLNKVNVAHVVYTLNDSYDLPREEIADLLEAWGLG